MTELEFLQLLDSLEPGELTAADKALNDVCNYIEKTVFSGKVDYAGKRAFAAAILIRYGAMCAPEAEITMTFRNRKAAKETWRFFQGSDNKT